MGEEAAPGSAAREGQAEYAVCATTVCSEWSGATSGQGQARPPELNTHAVHPAVHSWVSPKGSW